MHTPEFAFEKDSENVRRAVSELSITYPVALDNDYKTWKAFHNSFWPADYLVDNAGRIRHHHFGEGKYEETEHHLQELLKEDRGAPFADGFVKVAGAGAEAPPDNDVESPETYIGYERADSFLSPGGFSQDRPHVYDFPKHLELNQWGLAGNWTDWAQSATLGSVPGRIVYRFHARDLHLVLGPAPDGSTIRFRVKLDGHAPGPNHGEDTDSEGNGRVTEHRLYQLIRQKNAVDDRTFEIEFLDPGVQAFALLLAKLHMEMIVKRVNHSHRYFPDLRAIALLTSAAGLCAAEGITKITLPGTRVFPESITSTADGTLIIGSLGHGNILRVPPKKTVADEWIKPATGGLNGVLGVFADEKGKQLWVCSNNLENKGEATRS